MLRAFVLLLSIVLMLVGAWSYFFWAHVIWPVLFWGVLLFLATLFERWRYRKDAPREGDDWVATDERSVDPESGKLVQVYYQASTGERRYEPVDQ